MGVFQQADKLPRLSQRLRDSARGTNVHVLENDSVTINGVHFFGCTLWTDMALHGNWARGIEVANNVMNDYKRVRNSAKRFRRLTAADTSSSEMPNKVLLISMVFIG